MTLADLLAIAVAVVILFGPALAQRMQDVGLGFLGRGATAPNGHGEGGRGAAPTVAALRGRPAGPIREPSPSTAWAPWAIAVVGLATVAVRATSLNWPWRLLAATVAITLWASVTAWLPWVRRAGGRYPDDWLVFLRLWLPRVIRRDPDDGWLEDYRREVEAARRRRYLRALASEGCRRLAKCMEVENPSLFAPGQPGAGAQVAAEVEGDAVVFRVLYPEGVVIAGVRAAWHNIIDQGLAAQSLGLADHQAVAEDRPGGRVLVARPFGSPAKAAQGNQTGQGVRVIEPHTDADRESPLAEGMPPLAIASANADLAPRNSKHLADLAREATNQLAVLSSLDLSPEAVVIGPTVVQAYVRIPLGARTRAVTALAEDLAGALGMPSVRIAPAFEFPDGVRRGNVLVVEIGLPPEHRRPVLFADLVGAETVRRASGALPIAIGVTPSGGALVTDLARAPHMLVAGATGGGKSMFLLSVIAQLLFRFGPGHLRLRLVDPKRVEFTPFEGLPHLDGGVVRSLPDALAAMEDAAEEMDRRYALLEKAGQRDIGAYNAAQRATGKPEMPYVVLVVDEFADLLLQGAGGKEEKEAKSRFEAVVTRLAQKGRAAGVHLILTTQRPTRQSLPPTVKANLPVRVALRCASRLESEIVLDTSGAEMLQGRGDLMLMDPSRPDLVRAQAPLVTQDAIRRLVEWWADGNNKAPATPPTTADTPNPRHEDDRAAVLWEKVLWALLDRMEELEPKGLAVRREDFAAARKPVVEDILRGIDPAARLADWLPRWGAMGLIDGKAQESWTKAIRAADRSLARMVVFRLPTED